MKQNWRLRSSISWPTEGACWKFCSMPWLAFKSSDNVGKGTSWGGWVVMLLDTGFTHNFMSTSTARRLGMHVKMAESFEVAVANGERICSERRCNGV